MRKLLWTTALALMLPTTTAVAMDGGIPIRIPDVSTTCIDTSKHKISLHLRRFLMEKKSGWFSSDKEAGLLAKVSIETDSGETILYPKLFKKDVSELSEGIVSIPVERKFLHNFKLTNNGKSFSSISVDITILNKKKKDGFGVVLEHLSTITNSMPTTINPFDAGFKFFANYANEVVDKSLNEDNNVDDTLQDSSVAFAFSSDATCVGDEEKSGTIAVIKQYNGATGKGFIDIAKWENYCFRAKYRPAFAIQYASKNASGTCPANATYENLSNPYTLFVLNATPAPPAPVANNANFLPTHTAIPGSQTGPLLWNDPQARIKSASQASSLAEVERLEKEALDRCHLHGIDAADCF